MKQFKLITSALIAGALLAACSSEEAGQQGAGPYPITFKAAQAGSQATRTAIQQGIDETGQWVNKVVWTSGDTFTLFDAAGVNNTFTESGGAGTPVCTFNGTVTTLTPDWYALYPATPGAAISGKTITGAVLPAAQTAAADSFDPKANLQTAHTTTENITFEHAAAYLKFMLLEDYTITFEGNDGEAVAGTVNLTVADNGTSTYTVTSPETKVTLTTVAPADGEYGNGKAYLLAILPQNFAKGFTIKCTDSKGKTICFKSTQAIEFEAGEIVNMGNVYADGINWKEEGADNAPANAVAVDLGLPSGIKWANINLGAEGPEDYGKYYAWGATEEQDVYDWVHCPYLTQNTTEYSETLFTKYLDSTTSKYKDPSATDEDALKTVLDPEDDAAHVNWGGDWRMPTRAEQEELRRNCYCQWVTTYNGREVNGYIVYKAKKDTDKGKKNNYEISANYSVSDTHIFLPAAGYRDGSDLSRVGLSGDYWSSSLNSYNSDNAYYLYLDSGSVGPGSRYRYYGHTVRPVCP